MDSLHDTRIRIVKSDEVIWEEVLTPPTEAEPPGEQCICAASKDDRFSFGLWKRDAQHRSFERPYHEVAYIIEGEVEVTDDDGDTHVAGPGDIIITPQGSKGLWRNLTPVKKVWSIYEEPETDPPPYIGPGGF